MHPQEEPLRFHQRKRQRPRPARRSVSAVPSVSSSASLLILVLAAIAMLSVVSWAVSAADTTTTTDDDIDNDKDLPRDFLTEDSVVLITGAAGFLGSELAMALSRTYNPKKIICIDSMDGIAPPAAAATSTASSLSEQDLALMEFKRQRAFRLLQTLEPGKAHFYRTDFRPNVPDFGHSATSTGSSVGGGGEVPVLRYIFKSHPDITHVVHLADKNNQNDSLQAIPALQGDTKAGMMESLLEELLRLQDQQEEATGTASPMLPHFVYASSDQVYNHRQQAQNADASTFPNPPPFREDLPLTVPTSFAGAAKLMDEIIAQDYFDSFGIFSIGLRFFSVYGPWGHTGSRTFELAEQVIHNDKKDNVNSENDMNNIADYIYIDDAVDAIMAAMQFRPPPNKDQEHEPIVINVGSGQGTTLNKIASILQRLWNEQETEDNDENDTTKTPPAMVSIASIQRAEQLLGFRPRVPLQQGLAQLLAWHYDRAFPYGSSSSSVTDGDGGSVGDRQHQTTTKKFAQEHGIASCAPFDLECLRGIAIFPCASECATTDRSAGTGASSANSCTSTVYDDVLAYTRELTRDCENVLYTVALRDNDNADQDVLRLPYSLLQQSKSSGKTQAASSSYFAGTCNIAFVSETSNLVRQKLSSSSTTATTAERSILTHGPWTLVPLSIQSSTDPIYLLELLPKLSPGRFFGSNTVTKRAIYCDPNVVFADLAVVLQEFEKTPPPTNEDGGDETGGLVAMMVGQQSTDEDKHDNNDDTKKRFLVSTSSNTHHHHHYRFQKSAQQIVQETAYRMIRIAVIDAMSNDNDDDGFSHPIDSSFVVHQLQVVQLGGGANNKEEEVVVDDDARQFRCDVFGEVVQWNVATDASALQFILGLHGMWSGVIAKRRQEQPWWAHGNMQGKNEQDQQKEEDIPAVATKTKKADRKRDVGISKEKDALQREKEKNDVAARTSRRLEAIDSDDEEDEGHIITGWGQEHNGFGMPEAIQDAVRAVFGDAMTQVARDDDDDDEYDAGDSDEEEDSDVDETSFGKQKAGEDTDAYSTSSRQRSQQRDFSSDSSVWTGVLSSSNDVRHYVHIVPSRQVGAMHLDQNGRVMDYQ